MNTRRDFLANLGIAVGAAVVVASSSAADDAPPVRAKAAARSAREMEQWLLSTGRRQLDPRLIESLRGEMKLG
jgi:hypothetical protein